MKKKNKGLSAWQLTMMALGSVIGGSFFLGSSVAINAAGPAILISYILGGFLVYFILYALSEMTVANPDSGSFMTFATQAFGPGTGFVVGWVYWIGMILSMSSEATAVSILLHNWFPNISIALGGSTIITGVTLLNLLGADKLSNLASEFAYAGMKVFINSEKNKSINMRINRKVHQSKLATEFSEELTDITREKEKNKSGKKECNCNKK